MQDFVCPSPSNISFTLKPELFWPCLVVRIVVIQSSFLRFGNYIRHVSRCLKREIHMISEPIKVVMIHDPHNTFDHQNPCSQDKMQQQCLLYLRPGACFFAETFLELLAVASLLHRNSMIRYYDYFLLNCLDPYFHALKYYTISIGNMYSNTVLL